MAAAAIFLLLLATGLSGLQRRRGLTMLLFFASLVSIALLFRHHATDPLDINL